MTELLFPRVVDNTMLSSFKSCERKFFYEHLHHLRAHTGSIHLHCGGAFARGLEVARQSFWGEGLSPEKSLLNGQRAIIEFWGDYPNPEEGHKTWENCVLALESYFTQYPWDKDTLQPYMGKSGPAVEFSFALPIGIDHPQTGEPLLYAGRYDLLGIYQNQLYVVDEKTASRMGPSWRRQWTLRGQFTGYCWGALEFGFPVVGAIVRGVSFLKDSFGHEEVLLARPSHMIRDWLVTTRQTIRRMIDCWDVMVDHELAENAWTRDFADACSAYSGCQFQLLCDKVEPMKWVDSNFIRQEWNPIGETLDG